MNEFAKENLNCDDYATMNCIWADQLRQLGWQRQWGPDGPGWCPPDDAQGEPQSLYDAWVAATGTPDDLKLGMTKEPPEPQYRKPM